jgi:hypothetical protein
MKNGPGVATRAVVVRSGWRLLPAAALRPDQRAGFRFG